MILVGNGASTAHLRVYDRVLLVFYPLRDVRLVAEYLKQKKKYINRLATRD